MILECVFKCLSNRGLTLNRTKCKFAVSELVFMGHILSDRGIKPDEAKVDAIVNAEAPTTVGLVKSFLGLAGYCAKFIPDYANN